jgi:hypothetical protein
MLQTQSSRGLDLRQTRHEIVEKSSKIIPLGAPFSLNPIQSKGLTEITLHPWFHSDHLLF